MMVTQGDPKHGASPISTKAKAVSTRPKAVSASPKSSTGPKSVIAAAVIALAVVGGLAGCGIIYAHSEAPIPSSRSEILPDWMRTPAAPASPTQKPPAAKPAGALIAVVHKSTDGNRVQTWSVTSPLNGPGASTLRILPPNAPNPAYPHAFLYMLPVSAGLDFTLGDPVQVARTLRIQNAYNLTVVCPSFPLDPWFADSSANAWQQQESFMIALAQWIGKSAFASGGEKNYLIGFSKSGVGGQTMQLHRPDIWYKTASWDAPFLMSSYDQFGSNSEAGYGSAANFTANDQLTPTHISTWISGTDFTVKNRLWIGGKALYGEHVSAYNAELDALAIKHTFYSVAASSHAWRTDWVSASMGMVDRA
jgi:hypothetical protein